MSSVSCRRGLWRRRGTGATDRRASERADVGGSAPSLLRDFLNRPKFVVINERFDVPSSLDYRPNKIHSYLCPLSPCRRSLQLSVKTCRFPPTRTSTLWYHCEPRFDLTSLAFVVLHARFRLQPVSVLKVPCRLPSAFGVTKH